MATSDPATRYSDIQADKLSKKIEEVYTQAAREVRKKIADFEQQHNAINARMLEDLQAGKITENQYKSWLRGQVFTGEQWKKKLESITHVYMNADETARSMLKQTQRNVFAESANYTAYDVAMHSRVGYSFQIYDKNTVDRLIRDNPQMLPEWKIDEEKDYVWNEKRVQNAVTQGIVQGESVHDIGRRLTSELAARNASKMDMFARTAITGAQNAGRMERLHEAEDMGIVVKKKWLATLDDRTRDTHAELDGQVRNIDEPFEVDGMQIDYPGDPTAPPELVYNCRCTLIYVYPQFQQDNYGQRRIQETGEVVDYITYEQWKEQAQIEQPEVSTVDDIANESNLNEIDSIRQKIENHTGQWSTDELIDLGNDSYDIIKKRADEKKAEIQGKMDVLQEEIVGLQQQVRSIDEKLEKLGWESVEAMMNGKPELQEKLLEQYEEVKKESKAIYENISQLQREYHNFERQQYRAQGEEAQNLIANVRNVGFSGVTQENQDNMFNWLYGKEAKTEQEIVSAMQHYPSDWLNKSVDSNVELKPHWTNERAYYSYANGEIRITDRESTNVHELGHRFEQVVPGILEAEREFYNRRTAGISLEWLGPPYPKNERTRRDDFASPYMGKDYGGSAFELVSMGFQYALVEPDSFGEDQEMYKWILGILTGM